MSAKLRQAVEEFLPLAQVAFLWQTKGAKGDEVERYRKAYWNLVSTLKPEGEQSKADVDCEHEWEADIPFCSKCGSAGDYIDEEPEGEQISVEAVVWETHEPKGHWEDGGKVWVEDHDCCATPTQAEAKEAAIRECIALVNGCQHDMGFDKEIGPLGCDLENHGGCVCAGINLSLRALLTEAANG